MRAQSNKDTIDKTSQITIILPPQRHVSLELFQLLKYFDLIYILIWREIKIRYKQTIVGGAWAIIQPIITMVVFTVLFGNLMQVPSDDIPYPIFSFCALVPWTYFNHALTKSSQCLVDNSTLLTKVYFPRLVLPLASVLGALVDFFISFMILILMLFFYGIKPGIAIVFLPAFILLAIFTALAAGLWLSAINIQYRDVSNALPFVVQIWLFITPIAYSSSMIPEKWHFLYALNPMAGVVEGFRWSLLGKGDPPQLILLVSSGIVMLLLISGIYFFRKREDYFADII